MTPAQIINVSSIPPPWHLTAKTDKPVSEEVLRPSQETDILKMIQNAIGPDEEEKQTDVGT
jgi:hypothetical protein